MKFLTLVELIFLVQVCYSGNKWLSNIKLTGNSLKKKVPFERCYSICTEYLNCFGVSYNNNICYIFDYEFKSETQEGWQSKTKRDLIYQTPFINQNVKLYNGLNQKTYKSFITLESSCWRACKIDLMCFAITFNTVNNLCNLFSANFSYYGFERTHGWTSYTIQELNYTNYIENHVIRLSNHYKKKNILSIDKCWSACLSELDSCVAVSFIQKICYFYNSGYEVYKEQDSITIATRDIEPHIYINNPLQYNKTFLGFGFRTFMINNFNYTECYNACSYSNQCVGISYNASACYLNDNSYAYERLSNFSTLMFNKLDKTIRFIYDDIELKTAIETSNYNFLGDTDIDSCWSECLDDNNCKAIAYGSYGNNRCYLIFEFSKGYQSGIIAASKRFISIKRIDDMMNQNASFTYQDTRLSNPIANDNSGSVFDCWNKCKYIDRCTAISFSPYLLQCSMFDSNFNFQKESGWISQTTFKLDFMNYFASENIALQISGSSEIIDRRAESEKECWNYCMNQTGTICQSASYFNKRCYLFPSRIFYNKVSGWSTLTSYKTDFQQHFTYKDVSLGSLNASESFIYNLSNIDKCWSKCLNKPSCNGITYFNKTCYLFQGRIYSEIETAGAISFTTSKIRYQSPIVLHYVRYFYHFDVKSFPIGEMNQDSLIKKSWSYCEASKRCVAVTMDKQGQNMVCFLYDTNSYFRSDESYWISLTTYDLDV